MEFRETPEFRKDLKKLKKRYRTIEEDLAILKKALKVSPHPNPPLSVRINKLGIDTPIIKVKHIACKSLKGKGARSGLRLIYAYCEDDCSITLIEFYCKNFKAKEDRQRIKKYFT